MLQGLYRQGDYIYLIILSASPFLASYCGADRVQFGCKYPATVWKSWT